MSHTITIRVQKDLAEWLETTAQRAGMSQGQLVRAQLERARGEDRAGKPFMRLAGRVRLDKNLSQRKGFSRP